MAFQRLMRLFLWCESSWELLKDQALHQIVFKCVPAEIEEKSYQTMFEQVCY